MGRGAPPLGPRLLLLVTLWATVAVCTCPFQAMIKPQVCGRAAQAGGVQPLKHEDTDPLTGSCTPRHPRRACRSTFPHTAYWT